MSVTTHRVPAGSPVEGRGVRGASPLAPGAPGTPGAHRPRRPGRTARGAASRARRAAWSGVCSLRPLTLGMFAFAQAAAVAWVAYRRALPPAPQPGDHAWWHGGGHAGHGGAHAEAADGPVLYLALATAAVYLLMPLLALTAHAVRRHGGGAWTFAVLSGVASAVVAVPVTALATALTPGGTAPLWSGAGAAALTTLRLCALVGLVLAVAGGVPSRADRRKIDSLELVEKRP
ncbi:hypothetical protein AB0K80_14725 [Streptomyces sp. NPDC052682]|uniref:hypothetical protein n=1 Tax=Streptomyces sp. NPDC052682 TaxID=3154954 RepID=UPI003426A1C6